MILWMNLYEVRRRACARNLEGHREGAFVQSAARIDGATPP